jgi:hypothetical protein
MQENTIGNGIWRQVATLLYASEGEAMQAFRRLDERARKAPELRKTWTDFRNGLDGIFRELGADDAASGIFAGGCTPFLDAVALAETSRRTVRPISQLPECPHEPLHRPQDGHSDPLDLRLRQGKRQAA